MKKIICSMMAFLFVSGGIAQATSIIGDSITYNGTTWSAEWVPASESSYTQVTFGNPAQTGYTSSSYSGIYIGTVTSIGLKNNGSPQGNANITAAQPADFINIIKYFLNPWGSYDDTKFLQVDRPRSSEISAGITLSVTYNTGNQSGAWGVTDTSLQYDYFADFYAVKGGDEVSLFYVNPTLRNGTWSSEHLRNNGGNIPEISHIVVGLEQHNTLVPEPATMLLFGTGLVGLAGMARRKK